MKYHPLCAFAIAAALLCSGQIAQAETKIGLVNFMKIQNDFYLTHEERKNFEAQRTEKFAAVNDLRSQINTLAQAQQERQKQITDPLLSKEAKEKVMMEAQEAQGKITSIQREVLETEAKVQKELAEAATKIQRTITDQIHATINTMAATKGYDLVLNHRFGANGIPVFAYVNTDTLEEMTDEVIAELNKNAPAGWTPPAPAE